MEKYYDQKAIKQIGGRIKNFRLAKGYSMADIAAMTGFSINTISSIENGKDTAVSYTIAICQAIGIPLHEVFNIWIELKPRFELPPDRENRSRTTMRLAELVEKTNFFDTPKLVGSVLNEFEENYGVRPTSSEVSAVLKKLAGEGKLQYQKMGRLNRYSKPLAPLPPTS